MVTSVIVSAFVFPFVGQFCDNYSPKLIIPGAFFFRAFTTYLFMFVKDPTSVWSYLSCILMIVATIIENISVDSIFAKNLPKETRGVLNGVYSFAGQIGILLYSLVGGWLFDFAGPKSPFALIGILDSLYAIGVILASRKYINCFGMIGKG